MFAVGMIALGSMDNKGSMGGMGGRGSVECGVGEREGSMEKKSSSDMSRWSSSPWGVRGVPNNPTL